MKRIAAFVDVGYLCMAGAAALKCPNLQRKQIRINIDKVVSELETHIKTLTDAEILRIYWYDSCPGGARKTSEQSCISKHQNIKIRLGVLNRSGKQKGVDTMLVLDLFEHAIKGHISDALILSGDDDIRPGIERAQNHGVRVHLLGIQSEDEDNQSFELASESDTLSLWDINKIEHMFNIIEDHEEIAQDEIDDTIKALLVKSAQESIDTIHLPDIVAYKAQNGRGMPADVDGRLLAKARGEIKRDLNYPEKRFLRNHFRGLVEELLDDAHEQENETPLHDPSPET